MQNFKDLYAKLNYTFADPDLLSIALTHRSVHEDNNERLEYLGDSILNFIITEALYKRFKNAKEGELSRLRAFLVRGVTLTELAQEFDLSQYIRLGAGELKSGGAFRESILADATEAIIGAMYLDGGFEVCRHHVLFWYEERLNSLVSAEELKDPKSRLQEYLQSKKYGLPHYAITNTQGEAHAQTFHIECTVKGLRIVGKGEGTSRRKAEQEAATNFLNLFLESDQ